MKENTCCFTGHRTLPQDKIQTLESNLDREIESLIKKGVTDFISGGALGFDQMAASTILVKKQRGKNLRLVFALPCEKQDALWNERQTQQYQNLLRGADEIIYVSRVYDSLCMQRRNQYMVEHSAYCICALLYEKSGTGQTVRFAQKKGLSVKNILTK